MSLRMTKEEYEAFLARQGKLPQKAEEPKKSKYGNTKVEIDGKKFDSKKEADRYCKLTMLQKAGQISDLKCQVKFPLDLPVTIDGRRTKGISYVADFTYTENGRTIVEDTKGMVTDVFRLKRHLMKSVHNIDILLT